MPAHLEPPLPPPPPPSISLYIHSLTYFCSPTNSSSLVYKTIHAIPDTAQTYTAAQLQLATSTNADHVFSPTHKHNYTPSSGRWLYVVLWRSSCAVEVWGACLLLSSDEVPVYARVRHREGRGGTLASFLSCHIC